jgi:hypothetical protein
VVHHPSQDVADPARSRINELHRAVVAADRQGTPVGRPGDTPGPAGVRVQEFLGWPQGSADLVDHSAFRGLVTANPGLGTLANNGGPTQTVALLPGSPAIDAGTAFFAFGFLPSTDQRGDPRPDVPGTNPDIGAFEFQQPPPAPTPPPSQAPNGHGRDSSLGGRQPAEAMIASRAAASVSSICFSV